MVIISVFLNPCIHHRNGYTDCLVIVIQSNQKNKQGLVSSTWCYDQDTKQPRDSAKAVAQAAKWYWMLFKTAFSDVWILFVCSTYPKDRSQLGSSCRFWEWTMYDLVDYCHIIFHDTDPDDSHSNSQVADDVPVKNPKLSRTFHSNRLQYIVQ